MTSPHDNGKPTFFDSVAHEELADFDPRIPLAVAEQRLRTLVDDGVRMSPNVIERIEEMHLGAIRPRNLDSMRERLG
jgi:hypothetical protein